MRKRTRGLGVSPLLSQTPRRSLVLDFLIPRILRDHLAHLIAQLLPVTDEIAGLGVCHRFGALLFDDCDQGARFHLIDRDLPIYPLTKSVGHAIELLTDGEPDLFSPLHPVGRAGQFDFIAQRKPVFPYRS